MVSAYLGSMSENVNKALQKAIYRIVVDLQTYIIQKKLKAPAGFSATQLHRITGNLARSIQQRVTSKPGSVVGNVYSAGDVKYAAIHEYGGVISRYGRKVGDYQIRMPMRSFMRSSLSENQSKIVNAIERAIAEGMKA